MWMDCQRPSKRAKQVKKRVYGLGLHESMYDSKCDNLTRRPRVASLCDDVAGGSNSVVISLSFGVIEAPTEVEKCWSRTYNVHQRFRHRATVSAPSSSSGSCVCMPSISAMRIAWPI
jgi:hypothetical protein